jgi:asparagine synthase (glutamine-hydrolysing)
MCGITGLYSPNKPINTSQYYPAHMLLRHRGPDDEGFSYLNEKDEVLFAKGNDTIDFFQNLPHIQTIERTKLIFGQRRLAIIDLSKDGHQPFSFEELSMVFNGELFNYKDLRAELEGFGYTFRTASDTEVVIKAFHHWRNEAFHRFNGFWAIAIYDNKTKALTISRDRFGIKPLFYHFDKGVLYFASEMKYILTIARIGWEVNQKAVQAYLQENKSSYSENTFWIDIKELEPGHTMTLRDNDLKIERYWNFKPGLKYRTEEGAFEEFTYLFEDSVQLRMQSDVEVGSLLSGGLDSTTLVCTLQKLGFIDTNNFKSFSGIHDEAAFTETSYILDTVKKTGLKAAYIPTHPKRLAEDLPTLNLHIEDPFRSLAVYTQFLIYKHIRQTSDVTVVINGQGADELFGGYNEQYRVLLAEYLSKFKLGKFWKEAQFLRNHRKPTYERIYRLAFAKLVAKAFSTPNYFNQDGYQQIMVSPLREYFKYDDRNSMTFGIEARAPFMDYRLVEFGLTLDTKFKIDQSINKKIVRQYAAPIIPDSVRDRKDKMGFTTPQELWQRDVLKDDFDRVMHKISSDKLFQIPDLATAYQNYQTKNQGDFYYFWRVYNLYHWAKTWKVI